MVKKTIENKIKRLAKVLSKQYRIAGIYLFGSYARGEAGKHSDIDICVVSPDFSPKTIDLLANVRRAASAIEVQFDAFITTPEKFKNDLVSPLLHEIRQDAVKII